MARSSEFSNFERYENQLQQPYDEIKVGLTLNHEKPDKSCILGYHFVIIFI